MFLNPKKSQAGAAAAISIFILMVVIAGMLTTSLYSSSSSISNTVQQQDHQKAFFIAESGIQVAQFEMDQSNNCGDVPIGSQNYGSGSYEITVSSINGASDGCDVTVIGKSNDVVSTFTKAMLFTNPGGGGTFTEPFPDNTDFNNNWVEVITGGTSGNTAWHSDNCGGTCGGGTGGSFYTEAIDTGGFFGFASYAGYRKRSISTINTGTGLSIDLTGGYKKDSSKRKPWVQSVYIELYDSTNGVTTELWKDEKTATNNQWKGISETIALPANRSYDEIRIRFDLFGLTDRYPYIWVDEVNLVW